MDIRNLFGFTCHKRCRKHGGKLWILLMVVSIWTIDGLEFSRDPVWWTQQTFSFIVSIVLFWRRWKKLYQVLTGGRSG